MFSKIHTWIRDHKLITFFTIAFGYTWSFQILHAAFAPARAQLMSNLRMAAYGPSLAAILVPLIAYGPKGLLDFLRSRLTPKGNPIWYAVALFLIPALLLTLRATHSQVFPELPLEMPVFKGQVLNILQGFLVALTFGPLAEELGWRGFALPELQKRMKSLLASLILGVIWWAWHLPSLLIPAYQWAVGGMPVLLFLATILPGSVMATWLYNHSNGSVIPAILYHGSMNFFMGYLGFNSPYFIPFVVGGLWGIAFLIGIIWGPNLSKTRRPLASPAQEVMAAVN